MKSCPKCGCTEFYNENFMGPCFRQCAQCHQDWWTDINYTAPPDKLNALITRRDNFMNLMRTLTDHYEYADIKPGYQSLKAKAPERIRIIANRVREMLDEDWR